MFEIKTILFPTDFTEASVRAIPQVTYLVERLGARLVVLFVVEELAKYANFYVPHSALDNLEAELVESAKKKMESFVEEHLSAVSSPEMLVLRGDVAEEIVRTAAERGVDLIVMATHGRKGLEKVLLGSVAERVIKDAPCPVLTVNPYRLRR